VVRGAPTRAVVFLRAVVLRAVVFLRLRPVFLRVVLGRFLYGPWPFDRWCDDSPCGCGVKKLDRERRPGRLLGSVGARPSGVRI
jgi:hypothetical protein